MAEEHFLILKAFGLTPNDLVALHEFLGSDLVRPSVPLAGYLIEFKAGYKAITGPTDKSFHDANRKTPFATLLQSELDTKHGTYSVQVKVHVSLPLSGHTTSGEASAGRVWCPVAVMTGLFEALNVFPEKEQCT